MIKNPYSCRIFYVFYYLALITSLTIYTITNKTINHSNNIYDSIMTVCVGMIFWLLVPNMIYDVIKKISTRFIYKKAVAMGETTEGTIINMCMFTSKSVPTYFFVIKYNDNITNEERVFITPILKFSTIQNLGSNKCTVYFYKNRIIAGNFKSSLEANTPIYIPKNNDYFKYSSYYKMVVILIILELINAIVFASSAFFIIF